MLRWTFDICTDGIMSEIIGSGKNFAALGDGTPLSNQTCLKNETSKESSAGIESVGDVENFQCA